ncbi:MAG: hypothetical protein ACLT8I_02295 [Blautia faecis]
MGTDIDTIFKMLSWNSSEKEQLRGIDEGKNRISFRFISTNRR